jgi:hypothetical protein
MSAQRLPSIPPLEAPALRPKHLAPRPAASESGVIVAVHATECERVRKGDERAVATLNAVLDKRRTSNEELAEVIGCPEGVVRSIRHRERKRPFKVGHLYAVDKRTAMALWQAIYLDLLAFHGE